MCYKLNIAFLGGLFPKNLEGEISEKSKVSIQSAANALQWNIVDGLDQNNYLPVKIINSMYIGSYPRYYNNPFINTESFSHTDGANDINVGFINLFIVKHFSKYRRAKGYLRRWALEGSDKKILIGYALTAEFIACMRYIKRINPAIKTVMVVPDLPEYMNTSKKETLVYHVLKSAESSYILNNLSYVDGFVLLTKYMKDALGIGENYVVVEGIATDSFGRIDYDAKIFTGNRCILYTGTLNKKYGILNLIEAFKMIPYENYRLILCGSGDSERQIREKTLADKRIIYKGLICREEALRLQQEATVLVNPRLNNEEYTKYSFPSKTLEYLCSGTPVIAYKLDGMPDEYDDYIHYVGDDSPASLREKIIEICESDRKERLAFGERAREFMLEYKNKKIQTKKIIELALRV